MCVCVCVCGCVSGAPDSHLNATYGCTTQGFGMLTDDQREWVEKQNMLLHVTAVRQLAPPRRKWRRIMFNVAQSDWFNGIIMFVILVSVLTQAVMYNGITRDTVQALEYINYVITGIFVLEVFIKVAGLKWNNYIKDKCVVVDGHHSLRPHTTVDCALCHRCVPAAGTSSTSSSSSELWLISW